MAGSAIEQILRGSLRDIESLTKATAHGTKVSRELLDELKEADRALSARLRKEAKQYGGRDARFTGAAALAYQQQIRVQTTYLENRLAGFTEAKATQAVEQSMKRSVRTLQGLEKRFTGVVQPVRLAERAQMTSMIAEKRSSLLGQIPTSVDRYGTAMIAEFEKRMRVGLVQGLSMDEMIASLTGHMGPSGRVSMAATLTPAGVIRLREQDIPEGLFVRYRSWAERLVRTELAHSYNQARRVSYESMRVDMPGLQKKIVAILDDRTAPDSIAVNGQIRDLDDLFVDGAGRRYLYPPARPNDRETTVPWHPSWNEEAAAVSDPVERALLGQLTEDEEDALVEEMRRKLEEREPKAKGRRKQKPAAAPAAPAQDDRERTRAAARARAIAEAERMEAEALAEVERMEAEAEAARARAAAARAKAEAAAAAAAAKVRAAREAAEAKVKAEAKAAAKAKAEAEAKTVIEAKKAAAAAKVKPAKAKAAAKRADRSRVASESSFDEISESEADSYLDKRAKAVRLTPGERASAITYQGEEYDAINAALREKDPGELREFGPTIRDLDSALNKSRSDRNIVVFRGTHADFDIPPVGSIMQDAAYASTSVDREVGEKFRGYDRMGHLFEIEVPAGARALSIRTGGEYDAEREILLARDARFQVVKISEEDVDGKTRKTVRLRLVDEPGFVTAAKPKPAAKKPKPKPAAKPAAKPKPASGNTGTVTTFNLAGEEVREALGDIGMTEDQLADVLRPPAEYTVQIVGVVPTAGGRGRQFMAKIFDSNGIHIGTTQRSFEKSDGDFIVKQEALFLDDKAQGTGLGSKLINHQFQQYEKLGVTEVAIEAAEVGRYYWARVGYKMSAWSKESYLAHFDRFSAEWGLPSDRVAELRAAFESNPTAFARLPDLPEVDYRFQGKPRRGPVNKALFLDVDAPHWDGHLEVGSPEWSDARAFLEKAASKK